MFQVVVTNAVNGRVMRRGTYSDYLAAAACADVALATADSTPGGPPVIVSLNEGVTPEDHRVLGSIPAHYSPERARSWNMNAVDRARIVYRAARMP